MILYHGTNQILGDIDFNKSRLRTDFGKGFYFSDKLGNARDWAVDKSGFSEMPTVMRYDLCNKIFQDQKLSLLRFDNPTIEWLNFVRDNRRRNPDSTASKEPRHSYDIVSGPIANDKVAITNREFELLEVLVNNRNIALSREKLLDLAWGYDYFGEGSKCL